MIFWARVLGGFLIAWSGPFLFGLCCAFHGWARAGIACLGLAFTVVYAVRESRRLSVDLAEANLALATLRFYRDSPISDPEVDAASRAWRDARRLP